MPKLKNAKYEQFCQEYLIDLNGAAAAVRAGYSAKTANSKAAQLLTIVSIEARINELKEKRNERVEIKADDILRQLDILSKANISEYLDLVTEDKTILTKDGIVTLPAIQQIKFKDFKELTEEQLSCIESIKEGKQGIELRLHGKEWTIEKLSRHIGLYEKDNKSKNQTIVTPIIAFGDVDNRKPEEKGK